MAFIFMSIEKKPFEFVLKIIFKEAFLKLRKLESISLLISYIILR
jgi:hypothetical protein